MKKWIGILLVLLMCVLIVVILFTKDNNVFERNLKKKIQIGMSESDLLVALKSLEINEIYEFSDHLEGLQKIHCDAIERYEEGDRSLAYIKYSDGFCKKYIIKKRLVFSKESFHFNIFIDMDGKVIGCFVEKS